MYSLKTELFSHLTILFFLELKLRILPQQIRKKMPRFILNDENKRNSYGFRIKTEGISLERFKANPVMLDGHSNSNLSVIGIWVEIKKENGILSAKTSFDMEDDRAKNIASKVERGIIKGASMGISFSKKDFSYENGELILNQCEIYEASIVAIPSNANALRLMMDGEEMSEADIKTLCLSIAQNSSEFKPKINREMKLKLSQLAFMALGFSADTQEATEEQINTAVLSLEKSKKDLEAKLTLSEEKIEVFIKKEKEAKLSAINTMLENAISSGRITANKRPTFEKLAFENFDLAKETLDSLPMKRTFSTNIKNLTGTSTVNTMEDFQKLSIDEQLAFKTGYPDAYRELLKTL